MTGGRPGTVWLGLAAFYSLITVAYTWALWPSMGTALPHDSGDPGLNAWIVWWNAQALPFTERWWNAPIFFPVPGAFALSETLLSLSIVTTPLVLAGASAITAYNVAFVLSFPATALAAHALAHRLTGRHDAAIIAGLAFAFNPYRVSQLPHIQMQWAMWMPLCLVFLHRYLDSRRVRDLAGAGVCWVLNGLTSGYFLVFFAVLAGFWMLWFARSRREWLAIGSALTLASLVLAPALVGYQRHQAALGLSRDADEIAMFSADLSAFWAASPMVLAARWTFQPRAEGELYPGVAILVLTAVGAVLIWRRSRLAPWSRTQVVLAVAGAALGVVALASPPAGWKFWVAGLEISVTRMGKTLFTSAGLLAAVAVIDPRAIGAWRRRSPFVFYALAAVVMMLFALGPTAYAFGTKVLAEAPYSWLMALPGGHALRVPARFAMLAILCLSLGAALAFAHLAHRRGRFVLAAAVGVVVLADAWLPRFPTVAVSPVVALSGTTDGVTPVLEVPIQSVFTETAAMLRATVHRHPLINGFSGYLPAHYDALQEGVNDNDPSVFEALQQFGPFIVVVDRARDPDRKHAEFLAGWAEARPGRTSPLGPVFHFSGRPRLERSSFPPLRIDYVDANSNYTSLSRMLDGDLGTAWHSDAPQQAGEQVIVAFDGPVTLARLELDLGRMRIDYPRSFVVEIADPGRPPVVVWQGRGAGLALIGALDDHARAPVTIDLPPGVVGQRFTLTTDERYSNAHWSIAEVRAYGHR